MAQVCGSPLLDKQNKNNIEAYEAHVTADNDTRYKDLGSKSAQASPKFMRYLLLQFTVMGKLMSIPKNSKRFLMNIISMHTLLTA